jgi:hypothetical protein
MSYRRYACGPYEAMCSQQAWLMPQRYNIADDVCDKHVRDMLAMIWEDWRGNQRRVSWGELQDLSTGRAPESASRYSQADHVEKVPLELRRLPLMRLRVARPSLLVDIGRLSAYVRSQLARVRVRRALARAVGVA